MGEQKTSTRVAKKGSEVVLSAMSEKGAFKGYASVFDVVDGHGDVVMPGAFQQNLTSWKRLKNWPKLLWQHDATQPIGYITKLYEDAVGLVMEAQLLLELPKAQEAYTLIQSGVLDGLSIGYKVLKSISKKRGQGRHLKRINLFEVSLVTFPSNDAATIHDVKKSGEISDARLISVLDRLRGALKYV